MRVTLSRRHTELGWKVASKVCGWAYSMGVVSGGFYSYTAAGDECGVFLDLHPRPYVLGKKRERWLHPVRYGHRFYDVLGMCGKCVPWPCCGSIDVGHAADCEGDQ